MQGGTGKCRTLHFQGFELGEVPVSPFFSAYEVPLDGSTALWHISFSSWFCISANVLRVRSPALSRLSMDMLNRIRPSINSQDTLLLTGHKLDFMVLITTSWAWPYMLRLAHGKMAEHIPSSTVSEQSYTAHICFRPCVYIG